MVNRKEKLSWTLTHDRSFCGKLFITRFGCFTKLVFRYSFDPVLLDGPYLQISNHVSAFDSVLVSITTKGKPIYIVSSVQVLRGLLGRFLNWFAAPIPRRKGSAAFGTIRECLRRLKDGHPICIFAEGEMTWDGRAIPVIGGTASLVQAAKVPLVTFRLEGLYFSRPRWGRGIRRSRVQGRVTGVYSPGELANMSKDDILRLINRGIGENAYERQAGEMLRYKGRHRAECLEKFLYLCPRCPRISTRKSKGEMLYCDCGLEQRFTETGYLEPAAPFSTLPEWFDWQQEQLRLRRFEHNAPDGRLFSDEGCTFSRITDDNKEEIIGSGAVIQYEDSLVCAGTRFGMEAIEGMDLSQIHQNHHLMFSSGGNYYQVRVEGPTNLYKYQEIWDGRHVAELEALRPKV